MSSPSTNGSRHTGAPGHLQAVTTRAVSGPPRLRLFVVFTLLGLVVVLSGCSALDRDDGDAVAAVDTEDDLGSADSTVDTATAKEVLVVTGSKNPGVTVTTEPTSEQSTDQAENNEPTSTTEASEPVQTTEAPPATTERPFPDCSSGCNYVMEGDSITFNLGQWLWPKFCTEVSAATCVNSGISGHRIDQMIETARSDVDVHLGSGSNDVLIFWGGTNDLWQKFHSEDPAEGARGAYESTKAYIAERREKGWDYVVILTHPPMNQDIVAGWQVLNELIRNNEAGADTVIDVSPDPKLADPFDPVMKSTDGVHYKDPGRQVVVEEYLIPTIRQLSGR